MALGSLQVIWSLSVFFILLFVILHIISVYLRCSHLSDAGATGAETKLAIYNLLVILKQISLSLSHHDQHVIVSNFISALTVYICPPICVLNQTFLTTVEHSSSKIHYTLILWIYLIIYFYNSYLVYLLFITSAEPTSFIMTYSRKQLQTQYTHARAYTPMYVCMFV